MNELKIFKPFYCILYSLFMFIIPYTIPISNSKFEYIKFFSEKEHIIFSLVFFLYTSIIYIISKKILKISKCEQNSNKKPFSISRKNLYVKLLYILIILSILMNLIIDISALKYFINSWNVHDGKEAIKSLNGINIISQFYIPGILVIIYINRNKKNTLDKALLIIITFSLLIRAIFTTERLALFEFLVPMFILLNYIGKIKINLKRIIICLLIVLVFLVTQQGYREYAYHNSTEEFNVSNIVSDGFETLITYYADTTNKLYFEIKYNINITDSKDSFFYTINRIRYRLGLEEIKTENYGIEVLDAYNGRDVRMTNPGGYTEYYADFGMGAFLLYGLHLILLMYCYKKFLQNNIFYIGIYPYIYLSVIELPRYNYLYMTRFTIALMIYIYLNIIIKYKIKY